MSMKNHPSSPPPQWKVERAIMRDEFNDRKKQMDELRARAAYISRKVAQLVQQQGLHTQTQTPHRPPPHHELSSLELSAIRLRLHISRCKLRSAQMKWDSRGDSSEAGIKEEQRVEEIVEEANYADVVVNVQEEMLQSPVASEDGGQRLRADLTKLNESEIENVQEEFSEEEVGNKNGEIVEGINLGEMIVPIDMIQMIVPIEMYHTELNARQEVMKVCAMKSKNFEFDAHVLHDGYGFKGSEPCEIKESSLELNMTLRDRALRPLMGRQEDEYVDAILVYNTFEEIDNLNLRANSSQPGEDVPFVITLAHEIKVMRPP